MIGVGAAAVMGGAQLLGGLASWLGGSEDRSRRRQLYAMLMRQANNNEPIYNVQNMLAQYRGMIAPQVSRLGEQTNRRLGLDSGVAQGEIMHGLFSGEQGFLLNAMRENAQLVDERKRQALSSAATLYGGA